MARTYGELIDLVRDWSNRDNQVLGDGIIEDCLKYAADKAYRFLRIPPLEDIITYGSTALTAATSDAANGLPSITTVALPADFIEFIQIREIDSNGLTTRVFNEKVDIRSFNDMVSGIHYTSDGYYSRQAGNILLAPGFGFGSLGTADKIEVYYYKRLPALDASYTVTPSNYSAGLLNSVLSTTANAEILYISTVGSSKTAHTTLAAATAAGGTVTTEYFTGQLVPNWLRDDNERILLQGALAEVFFYLQDDDQSVKYAQLFQTEIASLNDEDKRRNAKGGNIQTNYSGGGLL